MKNPEFKPLSNYREYPVEEMHRRAVRKDCLRLLPSYNIFECAYLAGKIDGLEVSHGKNQS